MREVKINNFGMDFGSVTNRFMCTCEATCDDNSLVFSVCIDDPFECLRELERQISFHFDILFSFDKKDINFSLN